jgi:hypothetical protein
MEAWVQPKWKPEAERAFKTYINLWEGEHKEIPS